MNVSDGILSAPLFRGKIIDAVYGIGTVTPYQRLSFNPLVASTVGKSFVREGDKVMKGSTLIQTSDGMTVKAPFDGIVNFFPYRTGENAYSTTPMIILTDFTKRYILVSIEQQGDLRVKTG